MWWFKAYRLFNATLAVVPSKRVDCSCQRQLILDALTDGNVSVASLEHLLQSQMAPKKVEGKKPEDEGPRVYITVDVTCTNVLLVSSCLVLGCTQLDQPC